MSVQTMRRIYTISEAARRAGVHSHAIVLAEKDGRVPPARRDELGHRLYDEHDLRRLVALMAKD